MIIIGTFDTVHIKNRAYVIGTFYDVRLYDCTPARHTVDRLGGQIETERGNGLKGRPSFLF